MRTLILAAVVVVVGCSKDDPGPSCAQIADKLAEITKAAYPGHGDMAMTDRKHEIQGCEKRNLSAAERTCIMAATDLGSIAKCRPPKP